jgi:leucyl aminopeptidase
MARRAVRLAADHGLRVKVWDAAALKKDGFGAILAVGSGSARPPRLVQLGYEPASWRQHVVLVGKGITFDSGGLSLKPSSGMLTMKTDMSGAGAVLATMTVLRELGVAVKVTGLLPLAENMPSGSAARPGDVVVHYGGRTTEITNTDAEGRLVLADAMAYAVDRLAPDVLVDIATLTGAASVGLGRHHGALFSTDPRLTESLMRASADAGEQMWPMPLVEDYRVVMNSSIADFANTSRDRRVGGGAITAALYLREFAGGLPWAHLDIAGPARAEADAGEVTKGTTGFGTRLLTRWLEEMSCTG